jgi:Ca2+-binding RTX toxin-like protein
MPKPVSGNYLAGTSGDDTLDRRGFSDDWTIDGRAGNDTIYGGDGHDSLNGGRGNDLIYASIDDAAIAGGAGVDTVSFLYSATAVRVDLADGGVGPWPSDPNNPIRFNVISGVENVTGTELGDRITGNRAVNELDGGAGNDDLIARGTGDFVTGGTGADMFFLQSVTRSVTITDFHFNEGDRLNVDGSPIFSWVDGFAPDADGNIQQAWIGTCDQLSGPDLQVIVLGADTAPSAAWLI